MNLKKSIALIFVLLSFQIFPLEFDKGANVPDIHPRLLRSYLTKGVDNHQGFKIVYQEGIEIPGRMKKKWQERKLSGESIPLPGENGPEVIFIKKFK